MWKGRGIGGDEEEKEEEEGSVTVVAHTLFYLEIYQYLESFSWVSVYLLVPTFHTAGSV
jgi:hypothetical protein